MSRSAHALALRRGARPRFSRTACPRARRRRRWSRVAGAPRCRRRLSRAPRRARRAPGAVGPGSCRARAPGRVALGSTRRRRRTRLTSVRSCRRSVPRDLRRRGAVVSTVQLCRRRLVCVSRRLSRAPRRVLPSPPPTSLAAHRERRRRSALVLAGSPGATRSALSLLLRAVVRNVARLGRGAVGGGRVTRSATSGAAASARRPARVRAAARRLCSRRFCLAARRWSRGSPARSALSRVAFAAPAVQPRAPAPAVARAGAVCWPARRVAGRVDLRRAVAQ